MNRSARMTLIEDCTIEELQDMAEEHADALRDLMEIAGDGSGDPEYWTDTHPDPMPGPPRNITELRRRDRRFRNLDRWLVSIGQAIDQATSDPAREIPAGPEGKGND